MGRVRTKTVKRASRVIIEKYYPVLSPTSTLTSEYVTRLPSFHRSVCATRSLVSPPLDERIQRGPVRGISFKLQEEERERKDNYVPEVSALDTTGTALDVDPETKDMLRALGFDKIPVNVAATSAQIFTDRRPGGDGGESL
ncbi:hypothetical protein H4Q26_001995 [Puccinia striiformis f. sp. tritici PST-130]|nr:hypothetical protein H4Q26_001995 [Puccinia striiformis f. sp. tritici PST-130]